MNIFVKVLLVMLACIFFAAISVGAMAGEIGVTPSSQEVAKLLNQADIYKENGHTARAAELYTQATLLNPFSVEAWEGLGWIHLNEKSYDLAIRDFTKIIELAPKSHTGYWGRGLAYKETDSFKEAIRDFSKVLKILPDSGECFYQRGLAHYMLYHYKRTMQDLQRAIRLGIDDSLLYGALADSYLELDEPGNAAKMAIRAIERAPDISFNYKTRAIAFFQLDMFDESLEDINSALERNYKNASLYYMRGFIWMLRKDFNKARQDLLIAKEINPKDSKPLEYLAIMEFYYEKKFEHGIEHIKEAYVINPDAPYIQNLLCMMVSECPEEKLNDGKLAVKIADTLIEEPGDYATLGIKASAYAREGQFDKAVQYQTNALELLQKEIKEANERTRNIDKLALDHCQKNLELFKQHLPCNRPFSPELMDAILSGGTSIK